MAIKPIDRTAPPPPLNAPTLTALVGQIAQLGRQMGVANLVIVGRDPTTGEAGVFGSNEAMANLREIVAQKFGLFDGGETSWD